MDGNSDKVSKEEAKLEQERIGNKAQEEILRKEVEHKDTLIKLREEMHKKELEEYKQMLNMLKE